MADLQERLDTNRQSVPPKSANLLDPVEEMAMKMKKGACQLVSRLDIRFINWISLKT